MTKTPLPSQEELADSWCPHCDQVGGHRADCEYQTHVQPSSQPVESATDYEDAAKHLTQLLRWLAPDVEPLPSLAGLVSQVDNAIIGLRSEDATTLHLPKPSERPEPLKADPTTNQLRHTILDIVADVQEDLFSGDSWREPLAPLIAQVVARSEVDTAHAAEQATHAEEVRRLKADLEARHRELGGAGRMIEAMDADIDSLKAELQRMQCERDEATREFEDARGRSYLNRAEKAEAECSRLQAELAAAKDEIAFYKAEVHQWDVDKEDYGRVTCHPCLALIEGGRRLQIEAELKASIQTLTTQRDHLQAELERLKAAQSIEPHTVPKPDRRQVGRLE